MTATLFWRSAGRFTAPVMLAVVAAHLFLRNRTWSHEWMWAVYQFGFVTILLGPLVAGVAAWEGWRLATAADLLTTSLRPRRAALQAWVATLAWGLLAYAVGLVVVGVLVKVAGTPGFPDVRVIGAALPPVALLAAEGALGMLAGWWVRHALAAPAAALGCFLLSLWFYTGGPSQFITVGGATASLVGLAPKPGLELAQVLCFAAAGALALLLIGRPRPRSAAPAPPGERIPLACGAAILVAAAGLLLSRTGNVLEPVDAELSCVGSAPAVCVAPGYLSDATSARAVLLPYLVRLRADGVPVPATFSQGLTPGHLTSGPVDATFLLGDHSGAPFLVLNAYLDKACFDVASSRVQDEWSAVLAWLDPGTAKGPAGDPGIPAIARGPSTPAQRAWVRQAVADLSACGR